MFARHDAHERDFSRACRDFDTFEDARAFLRVALDERSRAHSTATTTTRAREDARARDVPGSILALMREACGRRDRARAALACAALLREMMGVVGADADGENAPARARRRRHKGGPTSERRSWGDREVLYCAMELLSEESKTVGGVHAATRTDARRVWDKIAATSAAGSARAERDAAERAMRMVLEEDDVESALMVLGEKRRKSPKNPVEGVRGTAGRFAGEGATTKKTKALARHLLWVRRVRTLRFSDLGREGYRMLPLIRRPGSAVTKRRRSAVANATNAADDAEAATLAREAKTSLREALNVDRGDAACAVALTQIEAFQGSFLRAREVLTQCLQHNPDDADVHAAYAELLMNARETGHPKNTTSSANFRSEIVDACKSVLRVDPTSKTALMTLWKMIDRETSSFERERAFLLEAVSTRVETRPESLWAWLMLATMLTGLTGLCTVQTDRMSSSSSSSSSDSDEPARDGDVEDVERAAPTYADAPLDVDVINRVFDEDRDWWPDVFFKLEKPRLRAGRRGEGRPPGPALGRLRAKFIVLRVLFPRRAPEQYESVYERLENIAKHRDSGASFKAYASALKTRARERARLYARDKDARGKKRRRKRGETTAPRVDDGAERVVAKGVNALDGETLARLKHGFTRKRAALIKTETEKPPARKKRRMNADDA
tara:strand:+ start:15428 stop:17437 length:2010 start_codon:yes stop_codon:yes gene_type:complete